RGLRDARVRARPRRKVRPARARARRGQPLDGARDRARDHVHRLRVLGVVVTAIALWRSRVVPRAVPLLMIVFIVTDAGLSQPLLGHVIALVAATWVAFTILQAEAAPQSAASARGTT